MGIYFGAGEETESWGEVADDGLCVWLSVLIEGLSQESVMAV